MRPSAADDISEAIDRIVRAVPRFEPTWQLFLSEWRDEPPIPYYIGMSELAHYVVTAHENDQHADFPELFAAVEAALQSDNPGLTNLIGAGLLEDIQNICSHRSFGHQVFLPWLGPRTRKLWQDIEEGMQRLGKWAGRHYRKHWWQFWRPKRFNAGNALEQVQNAELRRIIEASYRGSGKNAG